MRPARRWMMAGLLILIALAAASLAFYARQSREVLRQSEAARAEIDRANEQIKQFAPGRAKPGESPR